VSTPAIFEVFGRNNSEMLVHGSLSWDHSSRRTEGQRYRKLVQYYRLLKTCSDYLKSKFYNIL